MYIEKARGAHTALYKGTSIDSRILHLADPDALTFLQPSHGIVILEIGTHWCVQCRLMRPFIEKTALEFTGSMLIADVNADDASLTMKHFGVDSFPQLLFFEDGQYRKRECGFRDYPSFRQPMLDSLDARIQPNCQTPN